MEIWKNENIRTHNFITKEYWKDNYGYIKEILPKADIYVYILDEQIVGFVGVNNNYIEGIFVDINNQHSGIGTWREVEVDMEKCKKRNIEHCAKSKLFGHQCNIWFNKN